MHIPAEMGWTRACNSACLQTPTAASGSVRGGSREAQTAPAGAERFLRRRTKRLRAKGPLKP